MFFSVQVMEYIDENADTVLGLRSFATLPKHIVQLILSRDEMKTAELNKFHAAHEWSKAYCEEHVGEKLSDVSSHFCDVLYIELGMGVCTTECIELLC